MDYGNNIIIKRFDTINIAIDSIFNLYKCNLSNLKETEI